MKAWNHCLISICAVEGGHGYTLQISWMMLETHVFSTSGSLSLRNIWNCVCFVLLEVLKFASTPVSVQAHQHVSRRPSLSFPKRKTLNLSRSSSTDFIDCALPLATCRAHGFLCIAGKHPDRHRGNENVLEKPQEPTVPLQEEPRVDVRVEERSHRDLSEKEEPEHKEEGAKEKPPEAEKPAPTEVVQGEKEKGSKHHTRSSHHRHKDLAIYVYELPRHLTECTQLIPRFTDFAAEVRVPGAFTKFHADLRVVKRACP